MPQDQNKNIGKSKTDSKEIRNKPTAVPAGVGTSTSDKMDEDNSAEVRDAMNESQL